MNSTALNSRSKNIGGIIKGFGAGLLISTVLYGHFAVTDLTDPLRIIGFGLFFGGMFLARPLREKMNPMSRFKDDSSRVEI